VTDRPSTLGLMIRPAARIIRELPPRPESYRVAVSFRAAPLAAHCCRAEYGRRKSTDEKKPLEKTPGEKPIALWATSAPNGAGVLSNGYRFVGISPPTTAMYHHISTNVNTHQKIFGCCWTLLDCPRHYYRNPLRVIVQAKRRLPALNGGVYPRIGRGSAGRLGGVCV
jgi:hypothetical protein